MQPILILISPLISHLGIKFPGSPLLIIYHADNNERFHHYHLALIFVAPIGKSHCNDSKRVCRNSIEKQGHIRDFESQKGSS